MSSNVEIDSFGRGRFVFSGRAEVDAEICRVWKWAHTGDYRDVLSVLTFWPRRVPLWKFTLGPSFDTVSLALYHLFSRCRLLYNQLSLLYNRDSCWTEHSWRETVSICCNAESNRSFSSVGMPFCCVKLGGIWPPSYSWWVTRRTQYGRAKYHLAKLNDELLLLFFPRHAVHFGAFQNVEFFISQLLHFLV